jgi:hypothetical protein
MHGRNRGDVAVPGQAGHGAVEQGEADRHMNEMRPERRELCFDAIE